MMSCRLRPRAWVIASILLGVSVGILVWLSTSLLGLPNTLLLAVLAFLGEFVPNFGPIFAAGPAVLAAFAISPQMAVWVVLLYLVIQQVENQLLVPLIMAGGLRLHPVTVALFILAMGSLAGIVGAILAAPTAAIVKVLYEEFYHLPRHPDQDAISRDADQILAA